MSRIIATSMLLCLSMGMHHTSLSGLLTQEKMADLLVDLTLAEAVTHYYTEDPSTAQLLLQENTRLVYELHGIDADTLQRNYQYYLAHPSMLQQVYEVVMRRIVALEEVL